MESIRATVTFEQTIQKSRFIGYLIPLKEGDEVEILLQSVRDAHPQASHHCYAHVRGPSGQFVRLSDDKEPRGTAGMPILQVLQGAHLTDVLAVVVRYFGGTLLGTGGLGRAYSSTIQEALQSAQRVSSKAVATVQIDVAYDDVGSLEGWLRAHALSCAIVYSDQIRFEVTVFEVEREAMIETVLALTKRQARIETVQTHWEYR
jgi:uncharacterized YigZ family protein